MSNDIVKLVQRELGKETGLTVDIDGVVGNQTLAALQHIVQIPSYWPADQQVFGYIQYLCFKNGINGGPIDGKWGAQTAQGYEELKTKLDGGSWFSWRTEEGDGIGTAVGGTTVNDWPVQVQSELEKYYGTMGTNQAKVTSPYPLKIAWDTSKVITRFSCHEKVADSVSRILTRVHDNYGDQISDLGLDMFGGCLNVRKMKGGSNWSTHSWGIAIDWDPSRNHLRWGRDRANFARSEYETWWKLWEEEGWVSLGRNKNYDWMHVQAAKIRK